MIRMPYVLSLSLTIMERVFPSRMKGSIYPSSKSDLLKRFKQIPNVMIESSHKDGNAMIVDLSVIVNNLVNNNSIKFVNVELNILSRKSAGIDVICDIYP